MSRPFQEERNSQDLWMGLETVSEVVSVRRCAKSVKRKARDPPAVESGQPERERVISASSPLAPRQFLTTKPSCAAVYGPARTTTRHIRSERWPRGAERRFDVPCRWIAGESAYTRYTALSPESAPASLFR